MSQEVTPQSEDQVIINRPGGGILPNASGVPLRSRRRGAVGQGDLPANDVPQVEASHVIHPSFEN